MAQMNNRLIVALVMMLKAVRVRRTITSSISVYKEPPKSLI